MDEVRILKRFFSRKNEVYLVGLGNGIFVLKHFKDSERADNEWRFLTSLFNRLNVPKPIRREGNEILMEYIDGKVISEAPSLKVLADLAEWLAKLHSLHIKKGDCILRNFIIAKMGIFGVDWEEAEKGYEFHGDLIDVCGSLIWIYQKDVRTGYELCRKFLEFYRKRTGREVEDPLPGLIEFFSRRLEYRPELREKILTIISSLSKIKLDGPMQDPG